MRKIFLTVFILITIKVFSQTAGNIEVIQSSKINDLVKLHSDYCENLKGIWGYRIQIFFDSGNNARAKAEKIKAEFINKYPEVEAYLVFQQPYFKIRVGDFLTPVDAERFLKTE